ncbi:MAG: molybdate ABC transporter substrate-binding protein [Verrucomicrobiota bacterium]
MLKTPLFLNPLLLALFCFVSLVHTRAGEITAFAAASLSDVLKPIARRFESNSHTRVVFNFGASSTLARQIEEGAPADIFISADNEKMDRLQRKGLIVDGTRSVLLSNSLVVIASNESSLFLDAPVDLLRCNSFAIADPQVVPAGIYARKFMESAGIWKLIQGKVIPTDNVRGTLAAVESGNVDVGIVYRTDALISKKVKVVYQVPASLSPKIEYPVALFKDAQSKNAAVAFLTELKSPYSATIFQNYGFVLPAGTPNNVGQVRPRSK